jgi:hypothetical protein
MAVSQTTEQAFVTLYGDASRVKTGPYDLPISLGNLLLPQPRRPSRAIQIFAPYGSRYRANMPNGRPSGGSPAMT